MFGMNDNYNFMSTLTWLCVWRSGGCEILAVAGACIVHVQCHIHFHLDLSHLESFGVCGWPPMVCWYKCQHKITTTACWPAMWNQRQVIFTFVFMHLNIWWISVPFWVFLTSPLQCFSQYLICIQFFQTHLQTIGCNNNNDNNNK